MPRKGLHVHRTVSNSNLFPRLRTAFYWLTHYGEVLSLLLMK